MQKAEKKSGEGLRGERSQGGEGGSFLFLKSATREEGKGGRREERDAGSRLA